VAGFTHEFDVHRRSSLFLPKVKLEIVVTDEILDKAVATIVAAAKTGKIGDGKVFTFAVESAIRIRTDETGDKAV
jgi:nitrogen regulatory protein P-II 1